ncbi:TonB-dependent receptor [Pyxidicoccus parkwayensis]|nr:TonB-dependent receptor [Pyxidicoccus parkwaysis]
MLAARGRDSSMRVKVGLLAMVFLSASVAGAEASSVIVGTVRDAETKQPIPEVVITATSPSLQGEQTVVTDDQGQYWIQDLPPGTYTVRFERALFRPYARSDVPLKAGRTLRLEVLLVGDTDAEDDFGCVPPPVDVSSSTTGQDSVFYGKLDRVLGRSSDALGAVRAAEDFAPLVPDVMDVAGGLSINGASVFENDYQLDSLSVRDAVLGLHALSLSNELLVFTNVVTGGYLPQYAHATGGILNAVTPSGTNDLNGSVFAFWTPGLLEGRRESTGLAIQDALKHQGDFGATLSGPLLEDKLWFFAGVTPAMSRLERTPQTGSPDTSRTFDDARSLQALGKLTYLISQDHNVSLALITAPSVLEEGSVDSTLGALHYFGTFADKKVLVEVSAGWLSRRVTPREGEVSAADQYQVNANATWMAKWVAMHVMKAGVSSEWLVHERPGAKAPSQVFGGYVQDSAMFLNRFTLNVGARYDVQRLEEAGHGHVTTARLSPRVGLVIDPWANSQTKVFAQYGRFQGLIPLGLVDATEDVTLDPDLQPLASHELIAGFEHEVVANVALGATYTHRRLEDGLALVPRADESGVVLANPGSGLAADSPRAARNHDAVTVELHRIALSGWQGQISYTWSRLTGNYVSPFTEWTALEPERRLPLDRPHVVRAYASRELRFDRHRRWHADVGASYLGASGLLLEDAGKRTPWMQSLDVYLDLRYAPLESQEVTFRLDVFNVLNSQEPAQVAEHGTGLAPVRYQAPRQVRLGVRYDF